MLGTPPAFILSQDQTLMLKVFPCQNNWLSFFVCFANISGSYCFVWVDSFESNLFSEILYLEFSGSHYCLFVKVLLLLSVQRQLWYHITLLELCQQLFLFFQKLFELSFRFSNAAETCVFRGGFLIYHIQTIFVNMFLNCFLFRFLVKQKCWFQHPKFLSVEKTEKEGFEPSRRVSDLHP